LVCGQLFSSLFFFDFHRTNFSDSAGPFTSFDPVGFAIFANSSTSSCQTAATHEAFLVLGGFTVLSTIVFHQLKRGDGGNVSQQKDLHLG
jgi:hypothetical protein